MKKAVLVGSGLLVGSQAVAGMALIPSASAETHNPACPSKMNWRQVPSTDLYIWSLVWDGAPSNPAGTTCGHRMIVHCPNGTNLTSNFTAYPNNPSDIQCTYGLGSGEYDSFYKAN